MSDDMSIDDVVNVLNEKGHNSISRWEPYAVFGERIVRCDNVYYSLTEFEARAIAREYMRLDGKPAVRPATKQVMDLLALAAGGRDERLSVTIDCGGYEEHLGIDVIRRFLAELEADA